jgi:drug/metabolite transporter (DMT)-like permease
MQLLAIGLAVAGLLYAELVYRLDLLPVRVSLMRGLGFALGCLVFAAITVIGVLFARKLRPQQEQTNDSAA